MAVAEVAKTAIVIPSASGTLHAVYVENVQSFQRLMVRLFRHLHLLVTYIHNPLIASRSLEEHLDHLEQFFAILRDSASRESRRKSVLPLLFEFFLVDLDK
jgi:hypothetical protein